MLKVTEAIDGFLKARRETHNGPDLIGRWTPAMETQVNVAAGKGERVDGKGGTYTDGVREWWNIRIPKTANSEPSWNDYYLSWPLSDHVEAIGCTGWDFVARQSRWVGFDFDAITGHAAGVGIDDKALEAVSLAAQAVPWVEVRRSTGGAGLHLYVLLEPGVETANHTEHAALGRSVLSMLSQVAGFDFASQIDACGGNMWIWHRKMTAENKGFALGKAAARVLTKAELPANWRDHVDVVTRKRRKVRVPNVTDENAIDKLASGRQSIPLEDVHKSHIIKLNELGFQTLWIDDYGLLQTKTNGFAALLADESLGIKGLFQTLSAGAHPDEPNCFAFPLPNGAWQVYRFSKGVKEAATWEQDGRNWTHCYFNRLPDLGTACSSMGGAELSNDGGFQFPWLRDAIKAAEAMGAVIDPPKGFEHRQTTLKANKDGRLVVQVKRDEGDTSPGSGWASKRGPVWERVFDVATDGQAGGTDFDFDHLIRVVVNPAGQKDGTYIASAYNTWDRHDPGMVKCFLQSKGYTKAKADEILGVAADQRWERVSLPFQPEYPGGRRWNMGAPQLRFRPLDASDDLYHPHWDMIFKHCGDGLTSALQGLLWAQEANILTGADYLRSWFAALLREPFEPLPYLFFHGPENNGKSIIWESFQELLTSGVVKADRALTSTGDFNGELVGAILCVIEEKNIAQSPGVLNKIKDLVTGRTLAIRKMRTDTFQVPNMTHWLQCSNEHNAAPVFAGDTRITVIEVPPLPAGAEIPKTILLERLREEAPAFLRTLLDLPLPAAIGRLRIPVVETEQKQKLASENSPVVQFFKECLEVYDGAEISKSSVYEAYVTWCRDNDKTPLTNIEFGRQVKPLLSRTVGLKKVAGPHRRVDGYVNLRLVGEADCPKTTYPQLSSEPAGSQPAASLEIAA